LNRSNQFQIFRAQKTKDRTPPRSIDRSLKSIHECASSIEEGWVLVIFLSAVYFSESHVGYEFEHGPPPLEASSTIVRARPAKMLLDFSLFAAIGPSLAPSLP
jgi:hypothetical protein